MVEQKINNYVKKLKSIGLSENYIKNHEKTLSWFLEWYYKQEKKNITEKDLYDFGEYLRKKGISTNSIELAIVRVKTVLIG